MIKSRHLAPLSLFALASLQGLACGGDGGGADVDGGPGADAGVDAGDLACERSAAGADRDRFVVIARPFAEGGGASPLFEVLRLDSSGVLSATGNTFELTRAFSGTIAFTADGEIGVVAGDDGSLAVFRIDSAGAVTVLDPGRKYDFYASEVRASADGRRVHVIDGEFRNIGGGIYSLAIDCDGGLHEEGLIAPGQLPADIAYLGGGTRALIPADDLLDSGAGSELHLVDFATNEPTWIAGTALFGGSDAIVSEVAVSASGSLAVVGDNCGFCGPNRLAVAKLSGDSLVAAQTITGFNDPYDVIASPFDDRMLVVSGFGNGAFELTPSTAGPDPYDAPTELAYDAAPPQLPGNAVMITRGSLEGLVLLAENIGVRLIQFRDGASPLDLGLFSNANSNVGAIGIQP